MLIRRADVEIWIGASKWVYDEVRKGFVKGSNRKVDVLLENEE